MTQHDDVEGSSAPLIEHLTELRSRLIWAVLTFAGAMVLCFAFSEPLLDIILGPIERAMRSLGDPNPAMQYTAPQEYFFTLVRISMVGGLALSFPMIAFQLWRFVAPGLYRNEKNAFLPFIIASPLLFILGATFAYFIVTPLAMAFFLGFSDPSSVVKSVIPGLVDDVASDVGTNGLKIVFHGKVNESLDISLKLITAFGLCFQLPVLLTLMGKAGLISADGLAATRKYAVVLILLVSALVTPPDVITQLILFLAVYPLYEVSIFMIRRIEARREAELRAQGLWDDDDDDEAEEGRDASSDT